LGPFQIFYSNSRRYSQLGIYRQCHWPPGTILSPVLLLPAINYSRRHWHRWLSLRFYDTGD
jgi:hypothetical protein